MAGEIQGIYTTSLHVNDFEAARTFYREGIGLKERFADPEVGWAEFESANGAGMAIHVFHTGCKEAGGRQPGTVTGIIFTVDDAPAFAKRVEQAGGTITDPVQEHPWSPAAGTAADPSGNEFIFSEPSAE